VPAAAVFTAKDVVESDHTEARQMLTEVDYGPYGTHRVVASPIKLSGDAVPARARIHQLGEDTDAVLREFAGGAVPAARSAGNGQPKQV
jgi:succinate--hydroxymethylglutarate CoA-transferase